VFGGTKHKKVGAKTRPVIGGRRERGRQRVHKEGKLAVAEGKRKDG